MRNEFTAVVGFDGTWYWGYCLEVPEANGQGLTIEEFREDLAASIALCLEYKREMGLQNLPGLAHTERIVVVA